MITTRRTFSDSVVSEQRNATGGVDLLERRPKTSVADILSPAPAANIFGNNTAMASCGYANGIFAPTMSSKTEDSGYSMTYETTESDEEARLRMQRNLNRLLNYDKVEERAEEQAVSTTYANQVVAPENETVAQSPINNAEAADIRPTSTTMQFGDGETDAVYHDMAKTNNAVKESYKLNAKGKVIVALYALAVIVILSLIIINTGVLASIKNNNNSLRNEITTLSTQSHVLSERIENISSDEYVINIAENEYNMIKR